MKERYTFSFYNEFYLIFTEASIPDVDGLTTDCSIKRAPLSACFIGIYWGDTIMLYILKGNVKNNFSNISVIVSNDIMLIVSWIQRDQAEAAHIVSVFFDLSAQISTGLFEIGIHAIYSIRTKLDRGFPTLY